MNFHLQHLEIEGLSDNCAIAELAEVPDLSELEEIGADRDGDDEVVFYIDVHGVVIGNLNAPDSDCWFAIVPREIAR